MTSRRSPTHRIPLRRPAGPRCHGGASSLLRLGFPMLPQRAVAARASGWRELDELASVEHIVGLPLRAAAAVAVSS